MRALFTYNRIQIPYWIVVADLKRAAILFEEVVVDGPSDIARTLLHFQLEHGFVERGDAKKLEAVIRPSTDLVLDREEFLQPPALVDVLGQPRSLLEAISPRDGIAWPRFDEALLRDAGYRLELAMRLAALDALVQTWAKLNQDGGCTLFPVEQETSAINAALAPPESVPERVFDTLLDAASLPNCGELTWTQVLELRKSPFIDSFRSKLIEISKLLEDGNVGAAKQVFESIRTRELEELAASVRPDLRKATLTAIAPNIPLPVPNPVSIAAGVNDVQAAIERTTRFGWIYFLTDLRTAARRR